MFKGSGRHARKRSRRIGLLAPVEFALLALSAMREARATFRGARS